MQEKAKKANAELEKEKAELAKEKAAKRKAALANGAPLPTARTQKPFSSYCLEWLHTKKCTVKESTYIKYSAASISTSFQSSVCATLWASRRN